MGNLRIGIVSYWFNRGQANIGRYLRSALDELGHDTSVLARPTADTFVRPRFVDRRGVWDQPDVQVADRRDIAVEEYVSWARDRSLDVVFCFQNYQFEELAALRREGVKVVGTFMRESFGKEQVDGARAGFDRVYALTRSDEDRLRSLGLDPVLVPWGVHPELIRKRGRAEDGEVKLIFPAGFLSARKPVLALLRAFQESDSEAVRLLLKVQALPGGTEPFRMRELGDPGALKRRVAQTRAGRLAVARWRGQTIRAPQGRSFTISGRELLNAVQRDWRCRLYLGDVSAQEQFDLMARADVCVAPSRWEGLGLHLFEATGMGLPLVVNDMAPMNEIVRDGQNGLLVGGTVSGKTESGAPIHEVDQNELRGAIERLQDPELRSRLTEGALERRDELSWDHTVDGLRHLLANL